MPTSTTIRVQARELRPVAARIISYGSSSKMAGQATLYLLRVARGGHEWYVARRYSEFRVLYQSLKSALSHPHGRRRSRHGCGHCRELGRQFASVQFPSRYPVRSGFASAKEKIESARMVQLNAFVHVLMETTQGLMVDDDDDDDDDEETQDEQTTDTNQDIESCHRCDALRAIGEFLMVHEHNDDGSPLQKKASTESTPTTPVIDTAKSPTPRRPRLGSSGSVTFRVQELDVMFRPTSPLSTWATVAPATIEVASLASSSPNVLDEHELDELFLADYASPADDAVVHRQADVADGEVFAKPSAVSALRRTESLRVSRRL